MPVNSHISFPATALSTFEIAVYEWKDEFDKLVADGELITVPEAPLFNKFQYDIGGLITSFDTLRPILPAGSEDNDYFVNVTVFIQDVYGTNSSCHIRSRVSTPTVEFVLSIAR